MMTSDEVLAQVRNRLRREGQASYPVSKLNLGAPPIATKGWDSQEVGNVYAHARELRQREVGGEVLSAERQIASEVIGRGWRR